MQELFAALAATNSKKLCIGGITRREAKEAGASGLDVDPNGLYLFVASDSDPQAPIEILAKFFSIEQAEVAADLLRA